MVSFKRVYRVSYKSPNYAKRRSASFTDERAAIGYAEEKAQDGRSNIRIDCMETTVEKWRHRWRMNG